MHNVYSGLFIRSFSIRFYIFHLFVTFLIRVFIFSQRRDISFLLLTSILQSLSPRFLFLYFCNDISRNVSETKRNSVFSIRENTRSFKLNVTYEDSTCSYLISHSERTNLLRNFPLNTIHAF